MHPATLDLFGEIMEYRPHGGLPGKFSPFGMSKGDIQVILDETILTVDRFKILLIPRSDSDESFLSEERMGSLVHGAVAAFGDWSVESIEFVPVKGKRGVSIILRRADRGQGISSGFVPAIGIAAAFAAAVVAAAVSLGYSVYRVTRLGEATLESEPGTLKKAASGFQLAALAALAAVGFVIYKNFS